ncbi:MAG: alpha-hydroxy-acid oxidizing protein [Clostridiales bacterium]|nr:alpha-hydroxy-acid oxidizing protein [Clostridiales bacterium]
MADSRPLPGDSIVLNRRYLDHLLVEGRIVGAAHPTAETRLLGCAFSTPIVTAALSHLKRGMAAFALGAKQAGAACFIGMGSCEEMESALSTGAKIVKIIKPYADPDLIFERLACAKAHGAVAVGMDVEHAVNVTDDRDSLVAGYPMKLPSLEELKTYIGAAGLPFLIKGALSVRDALTCRDLGCAGVILSHHNGLMRWAVPPVMLLPEIRRAVGRDFLLVADGGIRDGFDAFKALALGADAVSVGRALMAPLDEGGPEKMADVLRAMTDEIKAMLVRTGSPDPAHIDPAVIHPSDW